MTTGAKNAFGDTKMSDLAKHIGIGQGTIYLYFKSKEELFEEIRKAADILVGRFASSNTVGKKAFNEEGYDVMRNNIRNNSDFKNLMKTLLNDRTMTPEKLVNELTGEGIMRRLKDSKANIKDLENKIKERAEKSKAAEEKHNRKRAKMEAEEARRKAAPKGPKKK